jgi:hypothetical protein
VQPSPTLDRSIGTSATIHKASIGIRTAAKNGIAKARFRMSCICLKGSQIVMNI